MFRTFVVLPCMVIILALGALYAAYGQIEPCRALAIERARRAENSSGLPVSAVVEPITRMETSEMSTPACTRELFVSWGERLSRQIH